MKTKKIRPSTFQRAATALATTLAEYQSPRPLYRGCCRALNSVGATLEEIAFFAEWFRPKHGGYWWPFDITPESYTARVIALQLAACLVEDGQFLEP